MVSDPVCAYCRRRPVDPVWRPFCCERCKLADLGRWLSGEYRVPGEPLPAPPLSEERSGAPGPRERRALRGARGPRHPSDDEDG